MISSKSLEIEYPERRQNIDRVIDVALYYLQPKKRDFLIHKIYRAKWNRRPTCVDSSLRHLTASHGRRAQWSQDHETIEIRSSTLALYLCIEVQTGVFCVIYCTGRGGHLRLTVAHCDDVGRFTRKLRGGRNSSVKSSLAQAIRNSSCDGNGITLLEDTPQWMHYCIGNRGHTTVLVIEDTLLYW